MKRVLEPELMMEDAQAKAYAEADFTEPHNACIERLTEAFPDRPTTATVLDLGCGSGDVTLRLALAHPGYTIHAVDGSPAMLRYARAVTDRDLTLANRIKWIEGRVPDVSLPESSYDIIFSNSLLHHLPDPRVLWNVVQSYARPGTLVFTHDLSRPPDRETALHVVEQYSGAEPAILKRDFFNSLLAAFTPDEVRGQLSRAGLAGLTVRVAGDRHLLIHGTIR